MSAVIYLPADGLLEHSFLDALHIDAGHTVTPNGSNMFLCVLIMADREHRDNTIAYGWFPVENIENYSTFLKMVIANPRTAELINRVGVACMHGRHLSFESVIREVLDKVLDRLDILHIIRNCRKYFPELDLNPSIIDYMKDILKHKYCTYAAATKGLQINVVRTSNRVEHEMITAIKVGIRYEDPLTGLVRIAKKFNRLQTSHQQIANIPVETNQSLIPFALNHYEYVKLEQVKVMKLRQLTTYN